MTFVQENPVLGVVNSFVEDIPYVGGLVAAAVLNATSMISLANGTEVRRLTTGKFLVVPSFTLDEQAPTSPERESYAILGAITMMVHEQLRR